MPYNARAKKVQLSALIVCLRGIFEDKYYELSQKNQKINVFLSFIHTVVAKMYLTVLKYILTTTVDIENKSKIINDYTINNK